MDSRLGTLQDGLPSQDARVVAAEAILLRQWPSPAANCSFKHARVFVVPSVPVFGVDKWPGLSTVEGMGDGSQTDATVTAGALGPYPVPTSVAHARDVLEGSVRALFDAKDLNEAELAAYLGLLGGNEDSRKRAEALVRDLLDGAERNAANLKFLRCRMLEAVNQTAVNIKAHTTVDKTSSQWTFDSKRTWDAHNVLRVPAVRGKNDDEKAQSALERTLWFAARPALLSLIGVFGLGGARLKGTAPATGEEIANLDQFMASAKVACGRFNFTKHKENNAKRAKKILRRMEA